MPTSVQILLTLAKTVPYNLFFFFLFECSSFYGTNTTFTYIPRTSFEKSTDIPT
jgi:hypothetical protein